MVIEGKTSKEYFESLEAYINKAFGGRAKTPELGIKRNEVLSDEAMKEIQNLLASDLVNYGKNLAAGKLDRAEKIAIAFNSMVWTLYRCGILHYVTYCVLLTLRHAVKSYPPECKITLGDSKKLLKQYVFWLRGSRGSRMATYIPPLKWS